MTPWNAYFRRARELPAHEVLIRAARLAILSLLAHAKRWHGYIRPSFSSDVPAGPLRRRLRLDHRFATVPVGEPAEALRHYVAHRFDLLGSGWVEVRHGVVCSGLDGHHFPQGPTVDVDRAGHWLTGRINAANLAEAQGIWRLVKMPYRPIDWQLDFKSGFRWSERRYYRDIVYGNTLGADVKVPWELARLQHLPQLALAYCATVGNADFGDGAQFADEIRNQILDFVATNPPQFGVNWSCTMEVAIRIVNLLLAVDLMIDAGHDFDEPFLDVVRRSAWDHARHTLNHLEWSPEGRGNHYLADIVGLLFAAAYLPASEETDAWLTFAVRELIVEAERQFLPDGGGIEASSGYHRLSAEMLLFATALILGIDAEQTTAFFNAGPRLPVRPPQNRPLIQHRLAGTISPLPATILQTLARAASLARDMTSPDGRVVQWGDTDSGRLLKLQPAWASPAETAAASFPVENPLDDRALLGGAARLLGMDELAAFAGDWFDSEVVAALARGVQVPTVIAPAPEHLQADGFDLDGWIAAFDAAPVDRCRRLEFPVSAGALDDVVRAAYPDFGHYVFRGSRFFLAIRCPYALPRLLGHAHDDTLAVELQIDGRDLFVDPGTFVYTPLPDERNAYRVASAHSVPRPAGHAGLDLSRGLFDAGNLLAGRSLFFGSRGFVGEIAGAGWTVSRALLMQPDRLVLMDLSSSASLADFAPAHAMPHVCWGYGRKTARLARSF